MDTAKLQLALFDDKFFVDKNFSFDVINTEEGPEYKYSFRESFEEKDHEILDLFTFLLKKTYDDPISFVEFTIEEYANYKGKQAKKLRRLTVAEEDGTNKKFYTNDTERMLYKMLNRNLIFSREFITNGGTHKNEKFKSLVILDHYERTTDLRDARKKVYTARIQKKIRENLSNFVFLSSKNDYMTVIGDYYRNPNMRVLYLRLGNIINNLKNKQDDYTTFDDLCFILGYDPKKPRDSKKQITESVQKLLSLDSLRGLAFKWEHNKKGYLYIPKFYINTELSDNLYNEKSIDKYKRLDTSVLTELSENVMFSQTTPFMEKTDLKKKLSELKIGEILRKCFEKVFKKEPSMEDIQLFMNDFCYKDDFGNRYGSAILKHVLCNGDLVTKTENYRDVKFVFN